MKLENTDLGKKVQYDDQYNPEKLVAIPRSLQREEMNIGTQLPFFGFDIWNHYEVSWLNQKGKPIVALAEIIINCESPSIIESKSMKLYFNTFNNTQFKDINVVQQTIQNDLEEKILYPVEIRLHPLNELKKIALCNNFEGICIDELDVACDQYTVDTSLIKTGKEVISETLYSNLLKSNCLVTNQPDWASLQIKYTGKKIDQQNLLRYIVSFRNHNEFHEHCVERIFTDLLRAAQPEELTVYSRFTRRGGLDINPYRTTTSNIRLDNIRLARQ